MTIDKPTSDALNRALLRSTTLVDEGRMEIDRSELRRLCESATPGPWHPINIGSKSEPMMSVKAARISGAPPKHEVAICATGDSPQEMENANAALIAAARTALPALLEALEAAEAMVSALNGDVTELGQRLEAAEERERGLRKALEEIARQKLHAEITDCDPDELDWLGGYEGSVKRARSAIAETAP